MSVHQIVRFLDQPMADWALKCGVPLAGDEPSGREPTLEELRAAVATLAEHTVAEAVGGTDFQLRVASHETRRFPCEGQWANSVAPGVAEGPASELSLDGTVSPDGVVTLLYCHGDSAPLVAVVRALVAACGPQVIFNDCDAIPWVVLTPTAVPLGPEPWWGDLPG